MNIILHAALYLSTSKVLLSLPKNFIMLTEAKLQAVSSKNMNSLHGLLALIGEVLLEVCHLFIVVSNCTPGSAQAHADWHILFIKSLAEYSFTTSPVVLAIVLHFPSFTTAFMKSSVSLTELFAFCPETV